MKYIIWILAFISGIIILLLTLLAFLWLRSLRLTRKRAQELNARIQPALAAIQQESHDCEALVQKLASDPLTRAHLLEKLVALGKQDWFPAEYLRQDKIAESDLVRWLYHENELGAVPGKIEQVHRHKVAMESRHGSCYLFRFKAHSYHWAESYGWMCGLAGPFWDDDPLQSCGSSTFSELEPYESQSHEAHVNCLARASTQFTWLTPCISNS